jgi:prepilin-type N-terminal cleavage/methylation domain-containing protein
MKIKSSCRAGFTLTEVMIVVGIVGLLAEIAIPNYLDARDNASTKTCIANIQQIDNAKQMWALEELRAPTSVPTSEELARFFGHGMLLSAPNVYCPNDPAKTYETSYDTLDLTVAPECLLRPNLHVIL